MITTVIRSLGRPSLADAIKSAIREQFAVIVVSKLDLKINIPEVKVFKINSRIETPYDCGAINVGAYLSDTEYINILDDDDEFVVGAGSKIRKKLQKLDSDIWIPGLKFKNRPSLCINKSLGVIPGNVACPLFKTKVIGKVPFMELKDRDPDYSDFFHIKFCELVGYKIDWFEEELILVRPKVDGDNGRGK